MVGNRLIFHFDYLGLHEASGTAISKDCGCYHIHAKFSEYKKETRQVPKMVNGELAFITEYGADVNIQLLTLYRYGAPGCDECECKEVKTIQFANTGPMKLDRNEEADFRFKRTVKKGVFNGWRVDTIEHTATLYVSDLPAMKVSNPKSGSWGGWVNDTPGESGTTKILNIYTCAVCTKGSLTKDGRPKVLGCVKWGIDFSDKEGDGRAGQLEVTLADPEIKCPGFIDKENKKLGTFQGLSNAALTQFSK